MIDRGLSTSMAAAANLSPENRETVLELVEVWRRHYYKNRLRDKYYAGDVKVKDLGISVLPEISRKLDPRIDWAAKCVNWWAEVHDSVRGLGNTFDIVVIDDAQELLPEHI